MKKPSKSVNKLWASVGVHMGWKKTQTQTVRRKLALKAHKGDILATSRALQRLANGSQDNETARKASQDAKYFYEKYKSKKGR
jgi:hypothetical protein